MHVKGQGCTNFWLSNCLNLEKGDPVPEDSTETEDEAALDDDEKDEDDLLDFDTETEAEVAVAEVLTLCSTCLPIVVWT